MNSIATWIKKATQLLDEADIATARLDALVLLGDELQKDKSFILAHPEVELNHQQIKNLNTKISKRATHYPLAYLRNKVEFYGREFYVDESVLVPRPETETLIDLLKSLYKVRPCTVACTMAEIGTGSGAIAITAALELPTTKVLATDIDPECLRVAKKNNQLHGTSVQFYQGNLLEPLLAITGGLSAILANLPYVPNTHTINQAAMIEPSLAIFGGPDGLDLYRILFKQIQGAEHKPTHVFTESLPPQHPALATIAEEAGYKQIAEEDFIQVFSF